jgi:hypothetical protein
VKKVEGHFAFLFVVVGLSLLGAVAVHAASFPPDCSIVRVGRCLNVGYFTGLDAGMPPLNQSVGHNTLFPSVFFYSDPAGTPASTWAYPQASDPTYGTGNKLPAGASAQHFIAFIHSYLYAPSPGGPGCVLSQPNPPVDIAQNNGVDPDTGCAAWRRDVIGAAFLVLSMSGGQYTAYPGSPGPPPMGPQFVFGNNTQVGVADAKIQFNNWAALVTEADAAGDVNWDKTENLPIGTVDSYSDDFGHDVSAYSASFTDLGQMIVFSSKSGNYEINRYCSNVEGALNPLSQILGYNVNLTAAGSSPTVVPGQTGTIDLSLRNSGPNPSDPGALQVMLPPAKVTKPCAFSCNDTNQSGLTSGQTAQGFRTAGSQVPGDNGANWYWDTSSFADSAFSTGSLMFKIPANAAPGPLTFDIYYYPADPNGQIAEATVTFTVVPISFPAVVGLNGDVHAGGGTCGGNLSPGYVAGNVSGGSFAAYAVSATGLVSNFGSDSGHNDLTLGANGNYSEVCETDLYQGAENGFGIVPAMVLSANSAVSPYDIADWSGTYFIKGNVYLSDSKPVSNKMTIVSLGGSVYVTKPITLAGAKYLPSGLPSVGIIAADNIEISAAATTVDAYLFADGEIDTCQTGTGSCLSTLTVDGFLMGDNILFDRLGPANSVGSVVAEKVTLNPALYIDPPTFFDAKSIDNLGLVGEGERPPLF